MKQDVVKGTRMYNNNNNNDSEDASSPGRIRGGAPKQDKKPYMQAVAR